MQGYRLLCSVGSPSGLRRMPFAPSVGGTEPVLPSQARLAQMARPSVFLLGPPGSYQVRTRPMFRYKVIVVAFSPQPVRVASFRGKSCAFVPLSESSLFPITSPFNPLSACQDRRGPAKSKPSPFSSARLSSLHTVGSP